ncbi:amino acid adenylation domain-containing protein (plasmid) [Actinacidiphila glaucinigra]|uniref:amino acid adenylation domain-containing protein n=1 Tax=Actinacidiphila glaucinigra TaxID=235986 RepID=UPI002DD9B6D6|nr:amino acid adenylation domain-containing protein [Actinacidiphila glaucinigra]WSD65824.1 amino acid adenylation domain-containing protein [Actinacidiphila glaucinigra]
MTTSATSSAPAGALDADELTLLRVGARAGAAVVHLQLAFVPDRGRLEAAYRAAAKDLPGLRKALTLCETMPVWRSLNEPSPLTVHDLGDAPVEPLTKVGALAAAWGSEVTRIHPDPERLSPAVRFGLITGPGVAALLLVHNPAALTLGQQTQALAAVLHRYHQQAPAVSHRNVADLTLPSAVPPVAGTEVQDGAQQPRFWITQPTLPAGDTAAPSPGEPVQARVPVGPGHSLESLISAHLAAVRIATGRPAPNVAVQLSSRRRLIVTSVPVPPTESTGRLDGEQPGAGRALLAAAASDTVYEIARSLGVVDVVDTQVLVDAHGPAADMADPETSELIPLGGTALGPATTHPADATVLLHLIHCPRTGSTELQLVSTRLNPAQMRALAEVHQTALALPPNSAEPLVLTRPHENLTMAAWQGPQGGWDLQTPLHKLLQDQARRTPDHVAVQDPDQQLTFRDLDERATRVAARLAQLGIGPEAIVAVRARRNADQLVAFVAVMKAGAAYLPLDPLAPESRTVHMLHDAKVTLVLSDATYAASTPEGPWTALEIRDLTSGDTEPDTPTEFPEVTGDDLAYVIYTSGSTGLPKGVEVPHRGLVNYLHWCVEQYIGERTGGGAVFSSVAYDMVVPNLYAPLLAGQRVLMIPERADLFQITEALAQNAPFAFLKLTPGQLDALAELLTADQAKALTGMLAVGADAFTTRTLAHWRDREPTRHAQILNEYGPTEASVGNSVHMIDDTVDLGVELVPIGRPIANTTMYVLDGDHQPVPVGVPGELYIGGACVVRGYRGRPELTVERFLSDPFAVDPAARMYRTGDIGRWQPGGSIEFLGRRDQQVKIRGYRVEPAEVEAALTSHPQVTEAIVTAVGSRRELLALAGYYVATAPVDSGQMRRHLAIWLPDHLVPTHLIPIPAVPLNANGKVDRSALPAPGNARHQATEQAAMDNAIGRQVTDALGLKPTADAPSELPSTLAWTTGAALLLARTLSLPTRVALNAVDRSPRLGELCVHAAEAHQLHHPAASTAPEGEVN